MWYKIIQNFALKYVLCTHFNEMILLLWKCQIVNVQHDFVTIAFLLTYSAGANIYVNKRYCNKWFWLSKVCISDVRDSGFPLKKPIIFLDIFPYLQSKP